MKSIAIDASLFKRHPCSREMYNVLIPGWLEKVTGFKLEYGTAFHKFVAAYQSGMEVREASMLAINHFAKPETQAQIGKDFRNSGHLLNTCLKYAQTYPVLSDELQLLKDSSGKHMTEVRFAYPFYVDKELDVEFILYGTIDALASLRPMEDRVIVDRKTTSTWDSQSYLKYYKLSPQLKIYELIVKRVAEIYPDSFGAFKNVGAMIDGIFLSKDGAIFRRSEVFHSEQWELDEIEQGIMEFVLRICKLLRTHGTEKKWPRNTVMCDASPYGYCRYFKACMSASEEDKEIEDMILEQDFTRREYNPMTHGE